MHPLRDDLALWARNGVDLDKFRGIVLYVDDDTQILHGVENCKHKNPGAIRTVHSFDGIPAKVCWCWTSALDGDYGQVALRNIAAALQRAEEVLDSIDDMPDNQAAWVRNLYHCAFRYLDNPDVFEAAGGWVRDLRTRCAVKIKDVFTSGTEIRPEMHPENELMFLGHWSVGHILERFDEVAIQQLVTAWDGQHLTAGMILLGTPDVIGRLEKSLQRSSGSHFIATSRTFAGNEEAGVLTLAEDLYLADGGIGMVGPNFKSVYILAQKILAISN